MLTYKFEKITGESAQVVALYNLLHRRKYNISHKKMPTFEEHEIFVQNNPYRAWYLIKKENLCVGSVYILRDNCIGINMDLPVVQSIQETILFITSKHKPLKEIKSIRPPNYYMNVSIDNSDMQRILETIGATKIQYTYLLAPLNMGS